MPILESKRLTPSARSLLQSGAAIIRTVPSLTACFVVVFSIVMGTAASAQTSCTLSNPLQFTIDADATATYSVWARVRTSKTAHIALASRDQCVHSRTSESKEWTWIKFDDALQLGEGMQDATIASTQGEVQIDKLLLMQDESCIPSGENGDNCVLTNIDVQVSGVEQHVVAGADMRVSAEVHGTVDPKVSFLLDGTLLTSSEAIKDGELYCAVRPKEGVCDVLPAASLGVGMHKLLVTVTDADRTVSVTNEFQVILEDDQPEGELLPRDTGVATTRYSSEEQSKSEQKTKPGEPFTTPISTDNEGGAPIHGSSVPVFVIGQGLVVSETLSGKVAFSIPADMKSENVQSIAFYADEQQIGVLSATEMALVFDTSKLSNRKHHFKAVVTQSSGDVHAVEIEALVNNGLLVSIKSWLALQQVRISLAIAFGGFALGLLLLALRSHVKTRRLHEVTGVNTQQLEYVSDSKVGARGYAVLAALTFATLGVAVMTAPATPAYDGNASMVVELEDARAHYEHETGTDGLGKSPYIILR